MVGEAKFLYTMASLTLRMSCLSYQALRVCCYRACGMCADLDQLSSKKVLTASCRETLKTFATMKLNKAAAAESGQKGQSRSG